MSNQRMSKVLKDREVLLMKTLKLIFYKTSHLILQKILFKKLRITWTQNSLKKEIIQETQNSLAFKRQRLIKILTKIPKK